jgi:hypothetical protein
MGFFTALLQTPALITAFSSNPTIRRLEAYLPEVALAFVTKQATLELDGYLITAKINGLPVALTIAASILALENILAGKTGSFLCGVIELDVVKAATPVPA